MEVDIIQGQYTLFCTSILMGILLVLNVINKFYCWAFFTFYIIEFAKLLIYMLETNDSNHVGSILLLL